MLSKVFSGAAVAVAAVTIAGAAFAQSRTEFATFQPDSGADGQPGGIVWLNNADGPPVGWTGPVLNGSSVGGYLFTTDANLHAPGMPGVPVVPNNYGVMDTLFNFHNIIGVPSDVLQAGFLLSATSTSGATCDGDGFCDDGDTITQGGISGSFSFTYTGAVPFVVDGNVYGFGTNLLSGTFTGASIIGSVGDANGALGASDRPLVLNFNRVNFSSDVVVFGVPSNDQLTLAIGAGAFPALGTPGGLEGLGLTSYRSAATGIFAATPTPLRPGVPEPGTWALMILGFGGAGAMLRSRRRALAA